MTTPAVLAPASEALTDTATRHLADIERTFGDRGGLIATLSCAPRNKSLDYLLGILTDPDNVETTLTELCRVADVRPAELLNQLAAGNLVVARAESTVPIREQLPDVVRGVMTRAIAHERACDACQGRPHTPPCTTCRGTGRITIDGEASQAKIALELGGLLKSGGGASATVNVALANLTQQGPGGGLLETVQAAAHQILRAEEAAAGPPVVDGEAVEAKG